MVVLLAALMLLVPAKAADAASESPVAEVAAEVVPVEAEQEAVPVEPSAVTSEAEAPVPEEAASPEEAPVAEETAAPAPSSSEPQPQPQPEPEPAPAEAMDTEAVGVPVGSQPVKTATELVTKTGKQLASAGEEVAPVSTPAVPAPVEAVGSPADLGAELERTLAVLVDSLEGLALLEVLDLNERGEVESLVHMDGSLGSTVGSTGSTAGPGKLLSGAVARLPERRLPTTNDPQAQAPIATGAVPLSGPLAPAGAHVSPRSSTASSFPALPVLLSAAGDEAQAGVAAQAASAPRPAAPPSPDRPASGHLGAGSGAGGSIFIPLLGVLALLALVAPRGYRRRTAVRDFPVPTPFVCALERPG
jgi:hypothetical protein